MGAIGYKRPPPDLQFPPGQSGNPSGRPKRVPDFFTVLFAALAAVPGKQRARPRSKLEAFVQNWIDSAIAGEARAQTLLVGALLRHGHAKEHEAARLTSDDQKMLDEYISSELKRRSAEAGTATPASDNEQDASPPDISNGDRS
jgi:hypothetical protein